MNKQQQKRSSRLWLWIPLTLVGGVVLILVGYCFLVLGAFLYADLLPRPTVGDAMHAAGQYYQALQNHDYKRAYTYLERNATITVYGRPVVMDSVNTLAATSQTLETQDGAITRFAATDGQFEPGKLIVDLTMKITRTSHTSEVHLKIELVGNDWKILQVDGI